MNTTTKLSKFEIGREQAMQEAIDFQMNFEEQNYSYEELAEIQERFQFLAEVYDLVDEFTENGII